MAAPEKTEPTAPANGTLPRWDLTPFFASVDDRSFTDTHEGVLADLARLRSLYDAHDIRGGPERTATPEDRAVLGELLDDANALAEQLRLVSAYLYARVTTDARDDAAANRQSQLQQQTIELGVLTKRLEAWLARVGVDDLVAPDPAPGPLDDLLVGHAFVLRRAAAAAEYQLSEAEESLAAELRLSGSSAWARLHRDVTARLTATVAWPTSGDDVGVADLGERRVLPMSVVRGLAHDPDRAVRRAAYDAELVAWEGAAVPLAAALNGAKGETSVLNRRRGWADDLGPALFTNNIDRATLDAMTAAVVASLPDFRRFLRAKARLLDAGTTGTTGTTGLAWWDLFAPLDQPSGTGDHGAPAVDWPAALGQVRDAFASYSPHLARLVERSVDESWIDAEPRDGKVGGAYCLPVQGGVSRVLMNFDGSFDAVQTLAHELGHAFHNTQLGERTPLQRQTPMALAETASIFCETIVVNAGLATAAGPARLALLNTDLQGAAQVVVDIHSRFLFESELCRQRAGRTLSVPELNELMLDAQERAYGDGLRADARHPYMWAVKGHYFTPFYNWPYTFGLLFGIGLYRRFEDDPDRFRGGYDELLSSTGMGTAAELAARFGIDVHDEGFWAAGLDVLRARIDDFERLAGAATQPG